MRLYPPVDNNERPTASAKEGYISPRARAARQVHALWADDLPCIFRCQFCDWMWSGPADQGRLLQHKHRAEHA